MPARVALVTPFAFPSVRGNAVTVERIARGLESRGVDLETWDLSAMAHDDIERQVSEFRPTLIHAFHAFRAGPFALHLARRLGVALVLTITGTDANHDLIDPDRAKTVRGALEEASWVTVFHESVATRLVDAVPALSARVSIVPQAAYFEPDEPAAADVTAALGDLQHRGPGPTLLFPAGIRPVKNPRFPLTPLDTLISRHPALRLVYVGPVLDEREGELLRDACRQRPWARHVGSVPHGAMRALYMRSDVVLNCSISEGGMANSVLEAMALGRAVLASDIEGNRSLVEDGATGLLFQTPANFAERLERLLVDPALRRRLGEAGRALIAARFTPARELDGYLDVYERVADSGLS